MDRFIETTPFFTADQRKLSAEVADLAEREVEVRAGDDEQDADEAVRSYVMLLFEADLLRYAVATPGQPFDLRSFCIIRETLSYSSSLADLAFVMQGLGTYAISLAATEHVRDFWLARAANAKAIGAFALTEPDAGSDVAAIKTTARREDDAYIIDGRKR
ncbi:MAG: acyl-CoA dehydrogenase, partial [Blastocatellia bacterium]|nr:acyl-CoA dehydrogenase [Blastocatellia bacterium]